MSNTGRINPNGPLVLAGRITVNGDDGAVLFEGDKTWLCRCGNSQKKPFCDGSHKQAGFAHDGIAAPCAATELAAGALTVAVIGNGPLHLTGPLVLTGADDKPVYCGTETWLCRCGQSGNKPFCDGTHKKVGFSG